jgi:pentatricopeptide repeat protein
MSADIISYNSVIESLGAAGRAQDALALLPVLRFADLQPTVTTLETLLSIAFSAGLMKEVCELWGDLTRGGMRPKCSTFNMYLTALISLVRCSHGVCTVWQFGGTLLRLTHVCMCRAVQLRALSSTRR